MSILKCLIMTISTIGIVGSMSCTKSSSSESSPSVDSGRPISSPQVSETFSVVEAYQPGTAEHISDVVSLNIFQQDGTMIANEELSVLMGTFLHLDSDTKKLSLINRVAITTDSHIELYNVNKLVMVLETNSLDSKAELIWSDSDFAAESILFAKQENDQNVMTSGLNFTLKECLVQEKEDSKQDQTKSPSQGEMPIPVVEPVCQTVSALLLMKEQATVKQESTEQ